MKSIAAILILLSLGGCAPLLIGTAAGIIVAHHERDWCRHYRNQRYYGNPYCQMPMGVHR